MRFGRAWLVTEKNQKSGVENFYSGSGGRDCFDGAGIPRRAAALGPRSSSAARAKLQGGLSAAYALSYLFFRHGGSESPWRKSSPTWLRTGCQAMVSRKGRLQRFLTNSRARSLG